MGNNRSALRYLIVSLAALGGFWLMRLGTGSDLSVAGQAGVLLAGLAVLIGSGVILWRDERRGPNANIEIREPALANFLFRSARSAPLWLGVRVYLGYTWFEAGREKFGNDAWMNGGTALRGYWQRATAVPDHGTPAITYGWYRESLQYMLDHGWYTWFAKLIVFGELLVGIALIAGALVGIAACFGAMMNFSYMLAGSAATNPVLFGLAIALMLGWRVAGRLGLDRILLPAVGTPWSRGRLLTRGPNGHRPVTSPS